MSRAADARPLLLLLFVALAAAVFATLKTPAGRIQLSSHAVERHGQEVVEIRCRLRDDGPLETWQKDEDPCILYFLVELKCSRIGLLIGQVWPSINDGCDLRERSSFVPGSGRYQDVIDYLSRFATKVP